MLLSASLSLRAAASPQDASQKDKESAEIEAWSAELTKLEEVRAAFDKYGKGGIWGVIQIATHLAAALPACAHLA
ncbi:hypothetical protein EVJ58_g9861 [Rhodofomes roseus]|uniref:Uncharacterized protein n=1 Tax=Rhodofomes roseus TaxID=34475 RepID=A0A4Y9XRJ3_9APHY|nr:hypothetical protein EVJ58_g9861 [Rhodofomes roseus]